MSEKLLICCVGLPLSGKSTWARQQGYPIVNPDSIRLAMHGQRYSKEAEEFVWATARIMVRALFLAGHDVVILDSCNNSRKRRDNWQSDEWATCFKVISVHENGQSVSDSVCLDRAAQKGDDYIVPIIKRMSEQWEPLGGDEVIWESTVHR